jgi:thiosulfate/3-mercaptopyruvate sulfurtransferase
MSRYDSHGVFSSPRALFMFKAFGHESCSILNGGLPLWEENNFPIEHQPPQDAKESEYPTPTMDVDAIAST